jgi:hypothetical protein
MMFADSPQGVAAVELNIPVLILFQAGLEGYELFLGVQERLQVFTLDILSLLIISKEVAPCAEIGLGHLVFLVFKLNVFNLQNSLGAGLFFVFFFHVKITLNLLGQLGSPVVDTQI